MQAGASQLAGSLLSQTSFQSLFGGEQRELGGEKREMTRGEGGDRERSHGAGGGSLSLLRSVS